MMGVPNNEPGRSGACPQGGDRLTAMVDGQLSPDEVVALEAHLEACATCQAELQDVRLAVAAVQSLAAGTEPAAAPPELWQRFQAGMHALTDEARGAGGAPVSDGRDRRRLRGRLIMLGAGIASMAACALLMLDLGMLAPCPWPPPPRE